jgi:plastocyanin|mmetsp:Transcript_11748/g.34613  ORF Transcript_11748/g.34613 Transcript_11748/m.34613 type:complete len:242 (-) Transcript_11748:343-1068(-)
MLYKIAVCALIAATHGAPTLDAAATVSDGHWGSDELLEAVEHDAPHGRELFPMLIRAHKVRASRDRARSASHTADVARAGEPMMSIGDKNPAKTLEMLQLNDELNTVVKSDSMCSRRHAMARAAGLAAGLAMAQVNKPGFAAATKMVKLGADNGQLVFVPDEIEICKGDSVTWTNNKAGPHNVVFDEEAIPEGVTQESISMDGLLNDEGATFTKKFDVAGSYAYYCEPHRGAGMNGALTVA